MLMAAMDDNFILPFQLETSRIRGRIVRLGSALDSILSAHKTYPDRVLRLTGETLTLCGLLSSMLKYDGIFTLQAQGEGAVPMIVADMTSEGDIRGCATFHEDRIANGEPLLGKGYMAFTVDQGEFMERYQGIVELKPESLIASAQAYFTQSEQIATGMMVSVGTAGGHWRGCGIMVQQMPEESANYNREVSSVDEDDWRRTMILLGSVREEELLDPRLPAQELLFRLFHEEGVRIYEPKSLRAQCRCSPERVGTILASMSDDDRREMAVDGKITMTCEFCSHDYVFNPDELNQTGGIS